MWDATRFAIGIILVVVLPMVALGGAPWTVPVFIALIGFEIWRRRRHLQQIAVNPELLAADRHSRVGMFIAACTYLVSYTMQLSFIADRSRARQATCARFARQ